MRLLGLISYPSYFAGSYFIGLLGSLPSLKSLTFFLGTGGLSVSVPGY